MTATQPFMDHIAPPGAIVHRDLNHHLFIHDQVVEAAHLHPNIRDRLSIILQQLAAHGRTPIVKGCSGDNRHWRRSPIGGNNGMQFYLWWTAQPQPEHRSSICIRAARHHDDHSPLPIGNIDRDYLPLSQPDFDGTDQSVAAAPWTPPQESFIQSDHPVRIIHGHPGSGKTTALWRAIETRSNQDVLYVSWSRSLAAQAQERFATFAPADVDVHAMDFISLLGQLAGHDVPRATLARKHEAFREAIAAAHIQPRTLGAWSQITPALFAEIRSVIAGQAIPGAHGSSFTNPPQNSDIIPHLTKTHYQALRHQLEPADTHAAYEAFRIIVTNAHPQLVESLPELHAANIAIRALRTTNVYQPFLHYDRIVIDEVQDLTNVEFQVFIELILAIKRHSRRTPHILISGDEGQTILPTAFRWASITNTLRQHGFTPQQFHLDTILRSPRRIAQSIDNSSTLYSSLTRQHRPGSQQTNDPSDNIEAITITCPVADPIQLGRLIDRIAAIPDCVVITADIQPPDYLPEHTNANILTTAAAKGLEYRHVCIITPGRSICDAAPFQDDHRSTLLQLEARNSIDRLRVAISRATQTLVFIELANHPEDTKAAQNILADSSIYQPDELVKYLTSADQAPEDTIISAYNQATRLLDTAPQRAWALIQQATKLLGIPGSETAVADTEILLDIHTFTVSSALRIIAEEHPRQHLFHHITSCAHHALHQLRQSESLNAFDTVAQWLADTSKPPFDALAAVHADPNHNPQIIQPLAAQRQTIGEHIDACITNDDLIHHLAQPLDDWLNILFPGDDHQPRVNATRVKAVNHALFQRDDTAPPAVLDNIDQLLTLAQISDSRVYAHLRQQQRRLPEAAKFFYIAQMPSRANAIEEEIINDLTSQVSVYIKANNHSETKRISDAIIDICPESPKGYIIAAHYYSMRGLHQQAIESATLALEHTAEHERQYAYRLRGQTYLTAGNHQRALDDLNKAIDLDKDDNANAIVYRSRATAHENLGHYVSAINDVNHALRIETNAETHYQLAFLHYQYGYKPGHLAKKDHEAQQLFQARANMTAAADLDPDNPRYRDAIIAMAQNEPTIIRDE